MKIVKPTKITDPSITTLMPQSTEIEVSTAETAPPKLGVGFKFTGLIQTSPEMLGSLRDSVEIIVDQRMEQNILFIENRLNSILENKLKEINRIIQRDASLVCATKSEIMDNILECNHDYLVKNYKGEFVGLTFDGKVIASSSSQVDLLNKIEKLQFPIEQIFVYSVPLL